MIIAKGAEAEIRLEEGKIRKTRIPKRYRLEVIDQSIRKERTKKEAKMISDARRCGIPTPIIYDIDDFSITMEYIDGAQIKKVISWELSEKIGELVGRLHGCGIVHGDLTTSNFLIKGDRLYLIDFGLAYYDKSEEAQGVDVHVLFQTFESSHEGHEMLIQSFINGYRRTFDKADVILERVKQIEARGRYA